MTFFESLLVLVGVAVALLQVSRRLAIPYPTMLAAAGVLLALVPGAPTIRLEPHMALALFIAPALTDAAFDFPLNKIRRLWRPLFAMAVVAVALSAGAVAWLGVVWAGLPLYAAIALGAIVAPPDAAAATAILGSVRMPRRTVAVLKGESLLNDATALLLFTAAVSFHDAELTGAQLALELGLAAPGGVILGIALARLYRLITPYVTGTLGGNLLEFVTCFGVWVVAERLHLSAVLCLVAFAITIARHANVHTPPRARIHSFATWDTAVFLLNVLAFLLMGFQARVIVGGMSHERLTQAAWFATAVVACLIVVRLAWTLLYNRLEQRFVWPRGDIEAATLPQGVLTGWCGMRGLVTLATAFALPASFPQRDLIVLTAFAVVLATLVLQGLTLGPLVRLLGLAGEDGLGDELARLRADMASAALGTLEGRHDAVADHWRFAYEATKAAEHDDALLCEKRAVGLEAIRRERARLQELRRDEAVGPDAYLILQEELDFAEVAVTSENERKIEEG
jgi:NhaP-type Na+/H+ or K+/H+ antiporter